MLSFRRAILAMVFMLVAVGRIEAKDTPAAILSRLPKQIGGLDHGKLSDFDDPKLGASIPFNGKGLTITLYVYDLGHEKITDGIADPIVQRAFEMAKGEIQAAKESGRYSEMKLLSEGRGAYQGREAVLEAKYDLAMRLNNGESIPVFSEIHVFGAWNHIFKLRITAGRENRNTLSPKTARFIAELLKAVEFLPPGQP